MDHTAKVYIVFFSILSSSVRTDLRSSKQFYYDCMPHSSTIEMTQKYKNRLTL